MKGNCQTNSGWVDLEKLRGGVASLAAEPRRGAPPFLPLVAESLAAALLGAHHPEQVVLTSIARVATANPALAGDAGIVALLSATAPPALQLRTLPKREQSVALRAYSHGQGPLASSAQPLLVPEALQPAIVSLLEMLLKSRSAMPQREIASACAGVVVLLRALTDINLARALEDARATAPSLPGLPGLIAAALLCAWAGAPSVRTDGKLDPAITLLLGRDVPDRAYQLQAALAHIETPALEALSSVVDRMTTTSLLAVEDRAGVTGAADLQLDRAILRIAARLLIHWSSWLRGFV